jgi:hypothetical protein
MSSHTTFVPNGAPDYIALNGTFDGFLTLPSGEIVVLSDAQHDNTTTLIQTEFAANGVSDGSKVLVAGEFAPPATTGHFTITDTRIDFGDTFHVNFTLSGGIPFLSADGSALVGPTAGFGRIPASFTVNFGDANYFDFSNLSNSLISLPLPQGTATDVTSQAAALLYNGDVAFAWTNVSSHGTETFVDVLDPKTQTLGPLVDLGHKPTGVVGVVPMPSGGFFVDWSQAGGDQGAFFDVSGHHGKPFDAPFLPSGFDASSEPYVVGQDATGVFIQHYLLSTSHGTSGHDPILQGMAHAAPLESLTGF